MKIKGSFVIRDIAGDIIIVPVGETALKYNGMITTTASGALIWEKLENGVEDEAELVKALSERFDVDEEMAKNDIDVFLAQLKEAGMLEE